MRALTEFLEGTGYQSPGWVESALGGSVVNEDEDTVNAGSPTDWGAQCLLIDHVTLTNSYAYNVVGATPVVFVALEVKVSAQSLADGDASPLMLAFNAAIAVGLFAIVLTRSAGVTSIEARDYYDGSAHTAWSQELVLNALYRFEFMWDTVADLWTVWVNGFLVNSGTLSGTAATTLFGTIMVGSNGSAGAYTARFDRIEVDDNVHIGPDAGEFVNPSGSPQQVQTGFGWR